MNDYGVVFGRFQPVHNGHIEHLLTAKSKCNHLFVGITNPDPKMIKKDNANLERSKLENNPFTFFERYQMLQNVLNENGVKNKDFTIVPFPLHDYSILQCYCPLDSVFYISIYERWGIRKKEILEAYNLNVEVMFDYPDIERNISGSNIRKQMKEGGCWHDIVPKTTIEVVSNIDLKTRFKNLPNE